MSDSDDDMPPPLDDMSEQIIKSQQARASKQPAREDEGEEIRLKPKAQPATTSVIKPSPDVPTQQPKI